MTDILSYIGAFVSGSWRMMTQTTYPGTSMTIAVILVGAFLIVFGFKILGYIFGFSLGDFERLSKRITKAKISKERQKDER